MEYKLIQLARFLWLTLQRGISRLCFIWFLNYKEVTFITKPNLQKFNVSNPKLSVDIIRATETKTPHKHELELWL